MPLLLGISYFVLSKVGPFHPLMYLDIHDYPINENCREKVKINKNFNAADDQQLAANKAQPVSTESLTSVDFLI